MATRCTGHGDMNMAKNLKKNSNGRLRRRIEHTRTASWFVYTCSVIFIASLTWSFGSLLPNGTLGFTYSVTQLEPQNMTVISMGPLQKPTKDIKDELQ